MAGGHLVDPKGISSHSTVVKGISVWLLDLIVHQDGLTMLCGNIGNAFITADCLEQVYSHAGEEFGNQQDAIVNFYYTPTVLTTNSLIFNKEKMTLWWKKGYLYAKNKDTESMPIEPDLQE